MKLKRIAAFFTGIFICISFMSATVNAQSAVVLDGQFNDWGNKPFLNDATGDEEETSDIVKVSWYPDLSEGRLYIYCERLEGEKKGWQKDWNFQITFTGDKGVRNAYVTYHPPSQQVNVGLYDNYWSFLWGAKGKWGADKASGNRLEFYVPLSYLTGSTAGGYQINMVVQSYCDRTPDRGSILISTASTFPLQTSVVLGALAVIGWGSVRKRKG